MTTVSEILHFLEELAPPERAYDFDNVGLLAGFPEKPVTRVLTALDVTEAVIGEAETVGAELIVAHHPLIFHPLRAVRSDDATGKKLIRLLQGGRSAICMHTNLDVAFGGVNDALAEVLGLRVTGILAPEGDGSWGLGRVGELPEPMALDAFLARVKGRLLASGLRYVSAGRPVHRVACCGGSGGSELDAALRQGCDTYVTADLKYDQLLRAQEEGINLIDADHFCTENVVVPKLRASLLGRFPDLNVTVSQVHGQTARFY